ncbi:T9SS type A sorting domain-containing protein [Pontibacter qinzhouensis]|nr:T9SS type A sorting domain-containing protein [Pontibacter qinzhouensis]
MKAASLLLTFLLCIAVAQAQNPIIETVTVLNEELKENSGLLNLNGTLITHNDSEGEASLYEINTETGAITRTVVVSNAENIDWEDIAQDQEYLYIGDIGNNTGSRTDLRIYRIRKSDYRHSRNTVTANIINFSYPDQDDFTPINTSNFDAEAIIALHDSLYIFTKNWGNRQSTLYALPKVPGTYKAKRHGDFPTEGLITGGTYNSAKAEIMLIGYTPIQAFAFRINGFSGSNITQGTTQRVELNLPLSTQGEAICPSNDNGYYVSSEGNLVHAPTLYHLTFEVTTGSSPETLISPTIIFPNPAREWLHIGHPKQVLTEVFDLSGKKRVSTWGKQVNLGELQRGIYLVRISDGNGEQIASEKIMLE